MTITLSRSRLRAALLALTLLAGCAPGQKFLEAGNELVVQGDLPGAIGQLEAAVKAEPENLAYRAQLVRLRQSLQVRLLAQADQARLDYRFDDALRLYQQVLDVEPANPRAREALDYIARDRKHKGQIDAARKVLAGQDYEEAQRMIDAVLAEDPDNAPARQLRREINDSHPQRGIPAGLKEGLRKQVTLQFHDANIKAVFEALSRSTGVNFVFDREVKPDLKTTVFLQNITVEDAIGVLTLTNQLQKKYLNGNTVLIYPNLPAKQKDYQDLMVKTFYLGNTDAQKMVGLLKSVLKTRDVFADEKLNSLTVRDTPGAVRLIEHLIAAHDLAEPEVMLEVEVLEVGRSNLSQLGFEPPGQFTLLNIVPSPTQTVAANGTVVTNVNPVTTTTQLTVANLRHFNSSQIGIPNPQIDTHAELGDTNLLANPRIRVKNREKAHILIGDKVPVITTTSTANVGISESVSYLEVGLKLDVEPSVHLDSEVGIKIALEVSNIVKEVTTKSGSLTYQLGTRTATTELRLRDGETEALAGLINDQERHSAVGFPGLIDLPIVSRLFSSVNNQHEKTEIVLLITPHIVRNLMYPEDTDLVYPAGTESAIDSLPLQLRPSSSISGPPPGGVGAAGRAVTAPPPAAPEPEPEPPPEGPAPVNAPPTPSAPGVPAASEAPGAGPPPERH